MTNVRSLPYVMICWCRCHESRAAKTMPEVFALY